VTLVLFALLCVLNGADVYSTSRAFAAGAVEANPVVAFFQRVLGRWWGLYKLPVLAGVGYGVHIAGDSELVIILLFLLVIGYSAVVVSNLRLARIL
jgi:hypothetical protein